MGLGRYGLGIETQAPNGTANSARVTGTVIVGIALAVIIAMLRDGRNTRRVLKNPRRPRKPRKPRTSGKKRSRSRPGYSPNAQFIHIRMVDADEFEEGSFRTIDPGRRGWLKYVIGKPKGQTSTMTQKALIEKSRLTPAQYETLASMAHRSERKPIPKSTVDAALIRLGLIKRR